MCWCSQEEFSVREDHLLSEIDLKTNEVVSLQQKVFSGRELWSGLSMDSLISDLRFSTLLKIRVHMLLKTLQPRHPLTQKSLKIVGM